MVSLVVIYYSIKRNRWLITGIFFFCALRINRVYTVRLHNFLCRICMFFMHILDWNRLLFTVYHHFLTVYDVKYWWQSPALSPDEICSLKSCCALQCAGVSIWESKEEVRCKNEENGNADAVDDRTSWIAGLEFLYCKCSHCRCNVIAFYT